jgi:two-component system CheB/CheR fusion protein
MALFEAAGELELHKLELEAQNEELKATRLAVEEALQRYARLFESAPVGYVVLDGGGLIRECNYESARMLGATREALVGRRFGLVVHLDDRAAFADFVVRVATDPGELGARHECDLRLRPLDQDVESLLEVRLVASCIDEAEPRVLVAIQDLTAAKRAEAAMSVQRSLKEENSRKDEFLATLSHELRNPLAPISLSLGVLGRLGPLGEHGDRALGVLRRHVDHLVRMVDDLLDTTRIARGKVNLQRETTDLEPLVRRTVEDYRPTFEAQDIAIELESPATSAVGVSVDPTRIVQVLGNLLVNARKFARRGGRAKVGLRTDDGWAVLTVSDDGAGISPEVLPSLFQPFVQAPQGLDRTNGGLGLGLATVRGLTDLHGGTVEARSDGRGRGSTFVVRLPLVPAPDLTDREGLGRSQVRARRVLVIEDNVDAADLLRDLLLFEGHAVAVAYDGAVGVELARHFRPELVLCDLGLPGMDGFQVAQAMRAEVDLCGVVLVALSGYARPEDSGRASEAGFDAHLPKPLRMEALETMLRV